MKLEREEIVEFIKKNLHKINVGDIFPKQTKLYSALDIPIEKKGGNKTIQAVVSLYIKWELSRPPSKEIRITEIDESPEYEDKRKDNGGARNIKYGPIIKPALLQYNYGEFTTYREIDEKIYGFKKQDVTVSSHFGDNNRRRKYKDELYKCLKDITDSALDGLERENLLEYKKVFVITGDIGIFKDYDFRLDDKTLLSDLIFKVYEGRHALDSFEEAMNKNPKNVEGYICIEGLTIFEFLDRALKLKSPLDIKKMAEIYYKPSEANPRPATDEEEIFIEYLEKSICSYLGFTHQAMNLDSKKRDKVYSRTKILYKLLGWKSVWKALQVNVLDCTAEIGITDFSQKKFFNILEPRIIHWTIKQTVNQYEIGKKKRESPKPRKIGTYGDVVVGSNEDYPYLANDETVNQLHCQVFLRPISGKFFESYLEQQQLDKDASDLTE